MDRTHFYYSKSIRFYTERRVIVELGTIKTRVECKMIIIAEMKYRKHCISHISETKC